MGAYKTATLFTMAVPLLTPFHYDLGHIHYRLLEKGWSQRRIAILYYLVTTTLSATGLYIAFGVR